MRRAFLLLAVLALAGCGGGSGTPTGETTSATPTHESTLPTTLALRAYFLGPGGNVQPVARSVSATPAVGRAVIGQLLAGPGADEGLTTAIPAGTELRDLAISNGVADVRLSQTLPRAARAQLVYTLTQFPTVSSVTIDGGPRVSRADFEDETPQILVETPLRGSTVSSPIRIAGTANTFEATFDAQVLDANGNELARRFVTATSGNGQRGTYDVELRVDGPPGKITLVVFEPSAENGEPLHRVEIPLRLAG
ncbi:MAG TPA: Gmad2 immunoglobulin-like domain-containing protein [Gaiellaceae bacterium]|jgi:hypothetical protein